VVVPLLGKRRGKIYAQKLLSIATASFSPLPHTHATARAKKSIASNEKYIRPYFPETKSARAPSRGVPSGARARETCILSPPPTQKKNFGVWGCSEKSRERTLTMLDRPWRYLSGENPIRLQNPLRIEICFDVRNVNNVCAMYAECFSF
jgi:hypothetical protein